MAVEHVLTECGIDHRRHLAQRPAAVAAAEIGHILHGQSGFLCDNINVRGILQRRVRQLILSIIEQAFGFVALVFDLQIRLGLFKSFHGRRLNAVEL